MGEGIHRLRAKKKKTGGNIATIVVDGRVIASRLVNLSKWDSKRPRRRGEWGPPNADENIGLLFIKTRSARVGGGTETDAYWGRGKEH